LHAGALNDLDKALEYARTARQLAPNDPKVAAILGALVFRNGEHSLAYNLLREATAATPRAAEDMAALAHAAYSLGKVEEARTAMREALTAAPTGAFAEEGKLFLALTAPEATAAAAEQALATNPKNVAALMVRAAAQVAANDRAGATATSEAALEIFPAFAPAQKQLAQLLADTPATRDRAFELATQARQNLPNDPALAEVLGRLASFRKDHTFAVQMLTEAAQSQPTGPAALFALGVSQAALGDNAAARDALTKAIAAGLPEAEAAEAAAVLETVKE
jgi:tetratricopeptide (TPR) repeat protein